MTEKFLFAFNGIVDKTIMSMSEAIEKARKRAMAGYLVKLSVIGKHNQTVRLATYRPNPESPLKLTNPETDEPEMVNVCAIDLEPIK